MNKIPHLSPLGPPRDAIVANAVDRMERQWRYDKVELAKMANAGKSFSDGAAKLLARQPKVFDRQLAEYNYRAERGWLN